jgi:hypothetical protein
MDRARKPCDKVSKTSIGINNGLRGNRKQAATIHKGMLDRVRAEWQRRLGDFKVSSVDGADCIWNASPRKRRCDLPPRIDIVARRISNRIGHQLGYDSIGDLVRTFVNSRPATREHVADHFVRRAMSPAIQRNRNLLFGR